MWLTCVLSCNSTDRKLVGVGVDDGGILARTARYNNINTIVNKDAMMRLILQTLAVNLSHPQASTSGERVPARGGHTCVVADFQLVVFGGTYYRGDVRAAAVYYEVLRSICRKFHFSNTVHLFYRSIAFTDSIITVMRVS